MISTFRQYDTRNFNECCELNSTWDIKDLIGVSQDGDSENTCIVTYPHQVLRYKLTTAPPFHIKLNEWVTKYKLTSAVVYDKTTNTYVGVFHDYTIRIWNPEIIDLEESIKYTFKLPILKILERQGKCPLIIFRNGDCVTLPLGLQQCGTFGRRALVKRGAALVDVAAYAAGRTDHVCCVLRDAAHQYCVITFPLAGDVCDSTKVTTVKVSNTRHVKNGPVRVTGNKIVVSSQENPVVYFTWSDSCISEYNVVKKSWKHNLYRYMHNMFREEVNMACIGKNYFAFFIKGYNPKSAEFLLPHIDIKGYQFMMLDKAYTQEAKVYSIGDFVVVADARRVFVLHVKKQSFKRPSWYHHYDFSFLVGKLRRVEDFLPIFGVTDSKKCRQISKYNFPKPKFYANDEKVKKL